MIVVAPASNPGPTSISSISPTTSTIPSIDHRRDEGAITQLVYHPNDHRETEGALKNFGERYMRRRRTVLLEDGW